MLGLYLGCTIHFELLSAYGENCGQEFVALQGAHPIAQHHVVERVERLLLSD